MPESDATHNEPQSPPTEEAWRDKILGDAMGYTKGLVTVLDSLNEGFRRRGKELEELRYRLTILQNERRRIQEEGGGFEAQLGALTAERDKLRSSLEERNREFDQLQQELSQSRAALEARAREIQEIQATDHDSSRQAEELREIVRDMERERLRARESAAQAQQEQAALRDSLARTERLLETARRDLTDSQEQIAILRGSLEREQGRAEYLEDQLRYQPQDIPGLNTTLQTARRFLRDIAVIVGGPPELVGGGEADQEEIQWAELVGRVRLEIETAAQRQEELATLRRRAESVREVLGTTEALPEQLRKVAAEAAKEPQGEGTLHPTTADTQGIPLPPKGPLTSPKGSKHRNALTGMMVECMLEGSGGETTRTLRGEMSRLNPMGLMGVFDERLPEGRRVVIRLTRGNEVLSCHGRVLRVRPSATIPGRAAVFDHLIRFDSPMQGLPD